MLHLAAMTGIRFNPVLKFNVSGGVRVNGAGPRLAHAVFRGIRYSKCDRQQHVCAVERLDVVRYIRRQDNGRAGREVVRGRRRANPERPAERVDNDGTWRPVCSQAPTPVEGKQDEAKALVVQHGDLSVPIIGRMLFVPQRRERRPEIESMLRPREPCRGRHTQPIT